jgi:hypothetical protein
LYQAKLAEHDISDCQSLKNAITRIFEEIEHEPPTIVVIEIMNGISYVELQGVFRCWLERVERVFGAKGDCLSE